MTTTLTFRDEALTGDVLRHFELRLESARLTVADLIRARVEAEVSAYNRERSGLFEGLVQPTASEQALNGYRLKPRRAIDAEAQVYRALDAFGRNGFFVLVDDRQAETLDEELVVADATVVSFVKLTPLVGG